MAPVVRLEAKRRRWLVWLAAIGDRARRQQRLLAAAAAERRRQSLAPNAARARGPQPQPRPAVITCHITSAGLQALGFWAWAEAILPSPEHYQQPQRRQEPTTHIALSLPGAPEISRSARPVASRWSSPMPGRMWGVMGQAAHNTDGAGSKCREDHFVDKPRSANAPAAPRCAAATRQLHACGPHRNCCSWAIDLEKNRCNNCIYCVTQPGKTTCSLPARRCAAMHRPCSAGTHCFTNIRGQQLQRFI